MAFRDVAQPTTWEERCALARKTREELSLAGPVLVDEMDDRSRAVFGDLPSPAIVLGPDGVIRCKLPWAEPEVLAERLVRLLQPEEGGEPGEDAPEAGAAGLRCMLGRALAGLRAASPEGLGAARSRVAALLPRLQRDAPDLVWRALLGLATRPGDPKAGTGAAPKAGAPPAEEDPGLRAVRAADALPADAPVARAAALACIASEAAGTPAAQRALERLADVEDERVRRWAASRAAGR